MLGPLSVRRRDGSLVSVDEWKTAKAADLLRVLALEAGRPVRVDRLLELLWPEADTRRGRASLRTATYHLRQALRDQAAVERVGDALQLVDAWVDVQAFELLAEEAERARGAGADHRVLELVHRAEALYVGDLTGELSGSSWWVDSTDHLRSLRGRLLLDAAEAALRLGWLRDARDLARAARELDPCSESAARVLMRALGGLGERLHAVAAYDDLRVRLGDAAAVDVSAQTRALHLQLLAGDVAPPSALGACPAPVLDPVRDALAAGGRDQASARLVLLHGPEGSGRRSAVRAACRQLGLRLRQEGDPVPEDLETSNPDVLLLAPRDLTIADDMVALCLECRVHEGTITVPVARLDEDVLDDLLGRAPAHLVSVLRVGRLSRESAAELVDAVLGGAASPALVEELRSRSDGRAARIATLAREWLASGRIAWTPEGLRSVPVDEPGCWASSRLHRLLPFLQQEHLEVLAVVAVAGEPVSPTRLASVVHDLAGSGTEVGQATLDRLVDLGLLSVSDGRLGPASDTDRQELLAWVRPSVAWRARRALGHDRVPQQRSAEDVQVRRRRGVGAGRLGSPLAVALAALGGSKAALALERELAVLEPFLATV